MQLTYTGDGGETPSIKSYKIYLNCLCWRCKVEEYEKAIVTFSEISVTKYMINK